MAIPHFVDLIMLFLNDRILQFAWTLLRALKNKNTKGNYASTITTQST